VFPNFQFSDKSQTVERTKFNQSLRFFFKQVAQRMALSMPFLYSRVAKITIDDFLKFIDENKIETAKRNDLMDNYIIDQMNKFSLVPNSVCKYCNVFNINLNNLSLKSGTTIDRFMKKSAKSNEEYCKIITSIHLQDDISYSESNENAKTELKSVSLSKKLLNYLPNLVSITIKNIKIDEINENISSLKGLKNVELVNNQLAELPKNIFDVLSPINQIIIDNNP